MKSDNGAKDSGKWFYGHDEILSQNACGVNDGARG